MVLTPSVEDGAKNVKVSTVVSVKAANGTVGKVKLSYEGKDSKGKAISGTVDGGMAKDKTAWTAEERLEPSATYTMSVTGTNPEGTAVTTKSSFKTQALTLKQQTFAQLSPSRAATSVWGCRSS